MSKVLLTSNLYKPNIGGIENSLFYIARHYQKIGCEVHIVASDINYINEEILPLSQKIDGVRVYRYSGNNFISRLQSGVSLFKKLRKHNEYEVVIARTHLPLVMMYLAGIKNVCYILPGVSIKQNQTRLSDGYSVFVRRLIPNLIQHFIQFLAVRIAGKVVVFSKSILKQVREDLCYKKFVYLTKPGVDGVEFSPAVESEYLNLRSQFRIHQNDIVLLGVGRFTKVKGFNILIEALKYLPRNYKLILVGQGSEKQKYKELSRRLGVVDRVIIEKATQTPSIYYKLADLYVMSSTHETLGQTVLEALVSGLPIVAFDSKIKDILTATSEITDISNSVLADEFSAEAIASSVMEAQARLVDGSFIKEKISSEAKAKFSWSVMVDYLTK